MNKYIKITTLSLSLLIGIGCTDNFEKLNINSNAPTLDNPSVATAAADALFSAAISNGLMLSFEFQRVQALYADLYGQHFATSINYFPTDRYQVNQAWLNAGWNLLYPRDINNLVAIIKSPNATPNQKLIARVWKVFLFHRMVDFYGDIPYFNAAEPDKPEVYDSQQAIYDDMFKELKAAADGLEVNNIPSYGAKDVIFGIGSGFNNSATEANNTARWKAFTNTLRMRLAMRISKADPTRAKKEFEEAMTSGGMTSNSNIAQARVSAIRPNALNQITDFNEFRMGAASESILNGYEDPRLPVFFRPAVGGTGASASYTGKYNGIQNGLNPSDFSQPENMSSNNSNVGVNFGTATAATNPRVVLTYAEHCFLMAEAALNGWAVTGSAKEWYEKGVTASMQQYTTAPSSAITAYLSSTKTPITPAGLNRPISTLSPSFASTTAQQREQIAIQKWIAVYPDGFEAWSEFRRTGFPRLYAPANYDPTTDVKVGDFIQRLPYTDDMRNRNVDGVKAAENRMGGSGQSVKLWFAGGK